MPDHRLRKTQNAKVKRLGIVFPESPTTTGEVLVSTNNIRPTGKNEYDNDIFDVDLVREEYKVIHLDKDEDGHVIVSSKPGKTPEQIEEWFKQALEKDAKFQEKRRLDAKKKKIRTLGGLIKRKPDWLRGNIDIPNDDFINFGL